MRNYNLVHKKEFLEFYKVVQNSGFQGKILGFQKIF